MTIKKEVKLRVPREPLQIPYPKGFTGDKSNHPDDADFHLSTEPRYLTLDEIVVASGYAAKLPYPQSVLETGALLTDEEDELLAWSHSGLDELERNAGLRSTRYVINSGGCQRAVRERVYTIREQGYYGSGQKALASN